jgi:hypothetical protein
MQNMYLRHKRMQLSGRDGLMAREFTFLQYRSVSHGNCSIHWCIGRETQQAQIGAAGIGVPQRE